MGSRFVKGAIRRTAAHTWEVIDDAGHNPVGIASVEDLGPSLRVNFDFTADAVVTGGAYPDETLAAVGIGAGPSIGLECAVVKLGRGGVLVRPETLTAPTANIWIDLELWVNDA